MASPQFHKYRQILEKNRASGDRVDIAAMRHSMDAVGGRFPDEVSGTQAAVGGVPGEWIGVPGAAEDAAVLYLHGGGFIAGSVDSHRSITGNLAAAMGCRVFAADYRLAPEHRAPAAVEDAVGAYRGLLDDGFDATRITIAGDSAGGGLTVATLVAARDAGLAQPGAAVAISPWIDLEASGESVLTRADVDPMISPRMLAIIAELYVGPDGDRRHPLAAPIHAEVHGLAPMLIHVGDAEILLDDAVRLAANIKAAGGEATLEVWPEMVHVWHSSAGYVPEADQAIARIAEFARPLTGLS